MWVPWPHPVGIAHTGELISDQVFRRQQHLPVVVVVVYDGGLVGIDLNSGTGHDVEPFLFANRLDTGILRADPERC